MTNKTQNLFEAPPFLEQKLGAARFESIPQKPGIYRFYDSRGELIYVGKAKNLRRRLFGYKRIRAGKSSRKVRSLVSRIAGFEWDELPTEQDALLEENRWIRTYQPGFNHANKSTETYYFIKVAYGPHEIRFHLSMNRADEITTWKPTPFFAGDVQLSSPIEVYGCFKGHNPVRRSLGALLRLLWIAEQKPASPQFLPQRLTRNLAPMNFILLLNRPGKPMVPGITFCLNKWFLGESGELMDLLKEKTTEFRERSVFSRQYTDELEEQLRSFFERTLRPHYLIRQRWLEGERLIRQDELDDYMVKLSG